MVGGTIKCKLDAFHPQLLHANASNPNEARQQMRGQPANSTCNSTAREEANTSHAHAIAARNTKLSDGKQWDVEERRGGEGRREEKREEGKRERGKEGQE